VTDSDDQEFRAPLARVPSGIIGVGAGLVMAGVVLGVSLIVGATMRQAVVVALVVGVMLGIGYALLARWSKRRAGKGITLGQRINRALVKGVVPADAVAGEWLTRLNDARRFWKVFSVVGGIFYGLMVSLGIVLIVTRFGDWRSSAEFVFFALLLIFSVWQGRLQLRRIRHLREQLMAREAPQQ
jgi:hypothetical protein